MALVATLLHEFSRQRKRQQMQIIGFDLMCYTNTNNQHAESSGRARSEIALINYYVRLNVRPLRAKCLHNTPGSLAMPETRGERVRLMHKAMRYSMHFIMFG